MKKVININTNIIYNSIKEAAFSKNIHPVILGRQLLGRRKNNTTFEYYDSTRNYTK